LIDLCETSALASYQGTYSFQALPTMMIHNGWHCNGIHQRALHLSLVTNHGSAAHGDLKVLCFHHHYELIAIFMYSVFHLEQSSFKYIFVQMQLVQ